MTRRTVLAVLSAGIVVVGAGASLGPLATRAAGLVTDYQFSPDNNNQFLTRGTLTTAGQSTTVTVKAVNGTTGVPGATVYLSNTGKGVATVATLCGATSTTLTTTPVACITGATGTIPISFAAPTPQSAVPTGGVDTITAQDASSSPTITESVNYYWGLTQKYVYDSNFEPIAEPGAASSSGETKITLTAKDGNGAGVSGAHVKLTLIHTGGGASGTAFAQTGTVSGPSCSPSGPLSSTASSPTDVTTDANGVLTICYVGPVASSSVGGVDTLTAVDDANNQSVEAQDFYNTKQQSLDHYGMSPFPIASAGTLPSNHGVPVTVTTNDAGGVIPYMSVYLTMTPPANGGTATAQDWTGAPATALSTTPARFVTDGNGAIPVSYTSGTATAGTDQLEAQNASASPTKTGFDYYTYTGATHYVFSPNPIAPQGTVTGSSNSINVTLTADDSAATPNPVPNSVVWLSFAAAGPATNVATAKVGSSSGPALSSTPQSFVTDNGGHITIVYTPANGTTTPSGGKDEITAANASSSPTITATDDYVYGSSVQYAVAPQSGIAPPGSLGPSESTPVVFTVTNQSDNSPAGSTTVYLSFTQATGGGSAASAQCAGTTLSSTPAACSTDVNGQITVTYSAPSTIPTAGQDTITAADAPSSPSQTLSDSYTFVGGYTFAPNPIASPGTLTPSQVKAATLTVTDASNSALSGAHVWLSFAPASGSSATMKANGTPLTSTPTEFIADGSGNIALSFTRSAAAPAGGSDVLTAQNIATSPTLSTPYAYGYIGQFAFTPAGPNIAPTGSLGPNTLRVVTVTPEDGNGTPLPGGKFYAKFVPTTGGGSASVNGVPLSSTPTLVTADNNGNVPIDYTTPGSLPAHGTDTITVQSDSTAHPALAATDSYSFAVPPPPPPAHGYWMVASDGGIFPFGNAGGYGSTGAMHLNQPIVGMALTPDHGGYFLVAADGGIFPFGDAVGRGSTGSMHLNQPIVGMAVTPSGNGYWLVAADGGIFPFGDAVGRGSTGAMHLNAPIVGMAATNDGGGYWLVASDGGIFPFGDAVGRGSTGAMHLNQPIVGMAATPSGNGYYLVASDGGIFPFGDAVGRGSTGAVHLNKPIVGMAVMPDNGGYWLVASDGGIFPFGDAPGYGSEGGTHLNQPIVGMAAD